MDHVSFILGILDSRLSKVSSENLIFSLDNKLQQLLALLELDRCVKTNGHPDSQIVELMIRSNLALTYLWSIVKD